MVAMNKFSKNVFFILIILNSFFLASNIFASQEECEEKPSVFIISPQDGFISESNNVKVLFGKSVKKSQVFLLSLLKTVLSQNLIM